MRHARQVGFKLDGQVILMNISFETGDVRFSVGHEEADPELWVTAKADDLLKTDPERPRVPVQVTRPRDSGVPEAVLLETVRRCFGSRSAESVWTDREELVYGSLFDFRTPEVLWQAPDRRVRVLLYRDVLEGHDACVTSGLTDPDMGGAVVSQPGQALLGFGYELVMLCRRDEPSLWREFVGWARYVVENNAHILRGNWLEYDQDRIPETDLGGFLVVAPATFPDSFPLVEGWGQWNLLLGATPPELNEAKESGVVAVAQRLFESGYQDWSTSRRASVMVQ
jgi:hypothetical protein